MRRTTKKTARTPKIRASAPFGLASPLPIVRAMTATRTIDDDHADDAEPRRALESAGHPAGRLHAVEDWPPCSTRDGSGPCTWRRCGRRNSTRSTSPTSSSRPRRSPPSRRRLRRRPHLRRARRARRSRARDAERPRRRDDRPRRRLLPGLGRRRRRGGGAGGADPVRRRHRVHADDRGDARRAAIARGPARRARCAAARRRGPPARSGSTGASSRSGPARCRASTRPTGR